MRTTESRRAEYAANRARCAALVARLREINARTVCAECGDQPIQWHHPDNLNRPADRVASLAAAGRAWARIEAEMARCRPLCRRCHFWADAARHARFLNSLRYTGKRGNNREKRS